MNEDLQNIDDLFRESIGAHEEDPSPEIWKSLQAQLDREDADKYKKKFIIARRSVITLIVLFISFVIFEIFWTRVPTQRITVLHQEKYKENTPVNHKPALTALSVKIDQSKQSPSKKQLILSPAEKPLSSQGFIKYDHDNTGKYYKIFSHKTNSKKVRLNQIHIIAKETKKQIIAENQIVHLFGKSNSTEIRSYALPSDISNIKAITNSKNPYPLFLLADSSHTSISVVQLNKKVNPPFKPFWKVTAFASPEFAKYNLQNDIVDNGNVSTDEKAQIEQREKQQFSYSVGLLASYQFKKHWALQSGIIYYNNAINIDSETIYFSKNPNGDLAYKYNSASGYAFVQPKQMFAASPVLGDSISASSGRQNIEYLSIPLLLQYKIDEKRFSFSPALGVSVNFLTGTKFRTDVGDSPNQETIALSKLEGTKTCDISLLGDIGISYNINHKWSLVMIPGFRYAVTPITKNNVVKTYPYGWSLAFGIAANF